jgi:hypothetical protein
MTVKIAQCTWKASRSPRPDARAEAPMKIYLLGQVGVAFAYRRYLILVNIPVDLYT